jgi:hypothetical protein
LVLAILLRHFDFLALRFSLFCLGPSKGPKQDRQNLRARKPKGLSRIAKIGEQENQRALTGEPKSKGLNRITKIWEQENQSINPA